MNKTPQEHIAIIREYTAKFQTTMQGSEFRFDSEAYQPFFNQLEATLTYFEQKAEVDPEEKQLSEHLRFLKKGVSDPGYLLLQESSKNLVSKEEDTEGRNEKYALKQHELKAQLNVITGHMFYLLHAHQPIHARTSEGGMQR